MSETNHAEAYWSEIPEGGFDISDPRLYLNRELSLLAFQKRVLEEAQDERNPLLERVKFLAIVDSNLEEFFMVRVSGLRLQKASGVTNVSIDGLTPARQLAEIRKEVSSLMLESRRYFNQVLLPELDKNGIRIFKYKDLNAKQKENADAYFCDNIFPVLTPLAVDTSHPFPHISNLSYNLAVVLQDDAGNRRFARLKVPSSLPSLIPLKKSSGLTRKDGTVPHTHYFVWLSQVVMANLGRLFQGMEIIETYPFHVVRNADLQIQELEAQDLLDTIEESVRRRRFGEVVRLVVTEKMPRAIRDILVDNFEVQPNDVYILPTPLVINSLMQLTRIERFDLRDKPFVPAKPTALRVPPDEETPNIFNAIRQGNILMHHPYESFTPVVDFLRAAAKDPNVLAIKQTLYRVGKNSPVVEVLLEAAREYKKQVAVLVELKARFDEESNIEWTKMLEQEGVHVTYGLLGLKTHSKIAMVVRREGDHIQRYVHLGTGNYNHITAQLYEDFGLFTIDEAIGSDTTDLFNYLTGYSNKRDYQKLLVAPINLRSRLEELIRNEISIQRQGGQGHIILKVNAIVDKSMISLLYEAAMAGVKIDLIIRGVCSLRPGIAGLSENIRVISVVGRFLEHSRIYYFHNNGQEKMYMGSADIMPRNLNERVEVLFPIEDKAMIRHVRDDILSVYMQDNQKARLMMPDGTYVHLQAGDSPRVNAQEIFINQATQQI
ncbi:MAG: polyphosphate kinase 1 [Anaerolineae bacterium]|nr:polyphosphate kinase 1 [Anaerolineae bacterium]